MTKMAAHGDYRRRMGRALIVGGLGCTLAGAAFLAFGPARVSGARIAFAALVLAYGMGSAVTGVILRLRRRVPPEAD
jgi:hypothetical protein